MTVRLVRRLSDWTPRARRTARCLLAETRQGAALIVSLVNQDAWTLRSQALPVERQVARPVRSARNASFTPSISKASETVVVACAVVPDQPVAARSAPRLTPRPMSTSPAPFSRVPGGPTRRRIRTTIPDTTMQTPPISPNQADTATPLSRALYRAH